MELVTPSGPERSGKDTSAKSQSSSDGKAQRADWQGLLWGMSGNQIGWVSKILVKGRVKK